MGEKILTPSISDRKVRIAILVNNPCIHDSRVIKHAEAAAAHGYEVCVFCRTMTGGPAPNEESGVLYKRHPWLSPRELIRRHFDIGRRTSSHINVGENSPSDALPPKGSSFSLLRLFARHAAENWVQREFKMAVEKAILDFNPDIIHANDLDTLPCAVGVKFAGNSKLIYDAHEIATEEYTDLPWGRRFWRAVSERRLIHQANHVVTTSNGFANYLAARYKIDMPSIIYNAPPISETGVSGPTLRENLGLTPSNPLIVFTGKLREDRSLFEILQALSDYPAAHLARVGPSDESLDQITRAEVRRLNLEDRVHFVPSVPHTQLPDFISSADVALLVNKNLSLNFDLALPNKLFEATLAGVPMVVGRQSAASAFILDNELGVIVNETDPSDIANGLRKVIESKTYRPDNVRLGQLREQYAWQSQARILMAIYDNVLKNSR